MNLKEIIRRTLLIGGILVATAGQIKADSPSDLLGKRTGIPLVNPSRLMYVLPRGDQNSGVLIFGYDQNKDGYEDTRLIYRIKGEILGVTYTNLLRYYIDLDNNHEFEDDEKFDRGFPKEKERHYLVSKSN